MNDDKDFEQGASGLSEGHGLCREDTKAVACGHNCDSGHDCGHGHGEHCGHGHDHGVSCSCGCENTRGHGEGGCECCAQKGHVDISASTKPNVSEFTRPILKIGISAILLLMAVMCGFGAKDDPSGGLEIASIVLYCVSYVAVSSGYIVQAVKGVFKGDVFNENMLMAVASIGAMALGEFAEGVAVMLLYCIGETLQDAAIARSKGDIVRLLDLKVERCMRVAGEGVEEVDSESLAVGDVVLVRRGEKIPSDGIVEEGESAVDCSSITGESVPVAVSEGSEVSGGTVNTGDTLRVRITKKFEDTQASKILRLVEDAQDNKPKAQKLITKFASVYTPTVFALALVVAFIPPLFYDSYAAALTGIWLKKALVFLVISCPCALVISIPLAFFAGIGKCSKKGVLVKGGNYLEAMRGVNVVCMDKTGTLTKGVFEVTHAVPAKGVSEKKLLDVAAVCESMSTHPIALSVLRYTGGRDIGGVEDYREYSGRGVSCLYNGRKLLAGNLRLMYDNGVDVADVHEGSGSVVYFAEDGKALGYVALNDAIKDDAKEVVAALKAQGKRVVMLTGDGEKTAEHVAKEVGIDEYHASLLPEDKFGYVEKAKSEGANVMFVGDGLNDAPAIKSANLGVCVGGLGNDASVEASDVVLSGGSVSGLPDAFAIARQTKNRVTWNIVLSLAAKLAIMVFSLAFDPMMWLAVIADVGVCIVAIINSVRR